MRALLFVLRLVFGALFLWSGIAKLKDPALFAEAVRNFRIVGDPAAPAVALFLPWLEIFAGLAVMWDGFARAGAAVLTACMAVFTLAVASAWARGLDISCACFGDTSPIDYPVKMVENLLLLGLGAVLWRYSPPPAASPGPPGGSPGGGASEGEAPTPPPAEPASGPLAGR